MIERKRRHLVCKARIAGTGRLRTGGAKLSIGLMSRSLRLRSMLHFGSTMRQAAGRSSAAWVWIGYSTPPFL